MASYYEPEDLPKFGDMGEDAPELWNKFMAYYGEVFKDGALTAREKSLIAFAVAHAIQCPYCIDSYAQALLGMGVSQEQMIEAVHAAAALKGGAALAHGMQAKNAIKKLSL
jgi:alkylhydroperoxidase/carboxymuconolactone decarboxylase family protein